jgi:cytochrome c oxidase subunit 2
MKVDLYERIWMWGVGVMLALFFGSTAMAALGKQMHPPSHIETIDPATVLRDARFRAQGVSVDPDGGIHVGIVGLMFAWLPADFTLPAGRPVTFHLTSTDVTHGFEIVRTNGQTMVVPGYISQFTTQFNDPGEYLIACNEYCGTGHHVMAAKMHVVPATQWQAPSVVAPFPASGGADHDGD